MKEKIKLILADLAYRYHRSGNKIRVMTIDETLDELLRTEKSLVRFGDGEIVMIRGKSLYFQKQMPELTRRLAEILEYREEGLMVAIPDIFSGLSQYRKSGQQFWKDHLLFFSGVYRQHCNREKIYGNAYVSRPYFNFADQSQSAGWFAKIRMLWEGKDVVVVEGAGTHNGAGNDLLDGAARVRRILCPAQNAGEKLEKIRNASLEMPRDCLYLLSLGPAAKLLTEDLFHSGRRVIDIGNLDMEYEWFLRGAQEKVKLEKHSVFGKQANLKAGYERYWQEVIKIIE